MNRWNIPAWLEQEITERDRHCVYCGVEFVVPTESRSRMSSWEHIINDAQIVTRENIAKCCISCNASKGTKDLAIWLQSRYCRTRGITTNSFAAVVKALSANGNPEFATILKVVSALGLRLHAAPAGEKSAV